MINNALVSVTSQGQITIPAKIRKVLDIVASDKLIARVKNGELYIKKAEDFFELAGTLKPKANPFKGKSIDEVINLEEEAVAEAVAERYLRKEKRSTGKLFTI